MLSVEPLAGRGNTLHLKNILDKFTNKLADIWGFLASQPSLFGEFQTLSQEKVNGL